MLLLLLMGHLSSAIWHTMNWAITKCKMEEWYKEHRTGETMENKQPQNEEKHIKHIQQQKTPFCYAESP